MRIVTVINDYVISSEEYPTNGIHEELSRIRNENKWDTQCHRADAPIPATH
jgi:hypothetical protein